MLIKQRVLLLILLLCLDVTSSEVYGDAIKEKKIYPAGEKIYQKNCHQDIHFENYKTIDDLKKSIKEDALCKPLKEQHLESLSLYLWEVKRVSKHVETKKSIAVSPDDKCPVCGMYVYKYPKWAAQIFYNNSHLSFDGVKDMMKYYLLKEEQAIETILATDYYSQKAIDAKKGFFVFGSDVYGPMGAELIPFENENDAKTFYMDHKGKKILRFEDITSLEVNQLDE